MGSLRGSGLLAFEVLGGVPAFQTGTSMGLPRLLYGFARSEGERTALEVGQDEMVCAAALPRRWRSVPAFGSGRPRAGWPATRRRGNGRNQGDEDRAESNEDPGPQPPVAHRRILLHEGRNSSAAI
jgi:hypothetical protein